MSFDLFRGELAQAFQQGGDLALLAQVIDAQLLQRCAVGGLGIHLVRNLTTDLGLAVTDGNSATETLNLHNLLRWRSERASFRLRLEDGQIRCRRGSCPLW